MMSDSTVVPLRQPDEIDDPPGVGVELCRKLGDGGVSKVAYRGG